MSELKPCPFCGGEPTIFTSEPSEAHHNSGEVHSAVGCSNFECQVMPYPKLWHVNDDEAIKHWNRRPAENKIKAEGVREAAEQLGAAYTFEREILEEYANRLEGESDD